MSPRSLRGLLRRKRRERIEDVVVGGLSFPVWGRRYSNSLLWWKSDSMVRPSVMA